MDTPAFEPMVLPRRYRVTGVSDVYNYRLLNAYGKPIGVISLESEDLPKLIMAGEKMFLTGCYIKQSTPVLNTKDEFIEFVVMPEPTVERT